MFCTCENLRIISCYCFNVMETITCSMRQAPWLMNFVFWLIDWLMESERNILCFFFRKMLSFSVGNVQGFGWPLFVRTHLSFFVLSFVFPFSQFCSIFLFLILILTQYLQWNSHLQGKIIKLAVISAYVLYIVIVINISFILFIPCFLCKTWNTVGILYKKSNLKLRCSGNM